MNTNLAKNLQFSEAEAYRALVERLAETNSPEVFSNGRAEHAAIIYETFLKFAKTRVRIFCRNLSSKVFQTPLIERMEMALLNSVKIDIIIQEAPESTALITASNLWKNQGLPFQILQAKPTTKAAKMIEYFATLDGMAYRFESNNESHMAYACFFNTSLTKQLDDVFLRFQAGLI
jgi:hypothetical protein